MKTRNDFVSNSSSSSFIIAAPKDYGFDSFCETIANAASDTADGSHADELRRMNILNLKYCLTHYELLFLGSFVCRTTEDVIVKSELPLCHDLDGRMIQYYGADDWKYDTAMIKRWESLKNLPPEDERRKEIDFIKKDFIEKREDGEEILHKFYDEYAGDIAVDKHDDGFLREDDVKSIAAGTAPEHIVKFYEEEKKLRVRRILDDLQNAERPYEELHSLADTYEITMRTVIRTRELLEAGVALEFESGMDPDSVEGRLAKGQRIFCVCNNYSGGGQSRDSVYSNRVSIGEDRVKDQRLQYIGVDTK